MQTILDVRKVDLWAGMAPDEIWMKYKEEFDRRVSTVFEPKRLHAFVQVREGFAPPVATE